MSQHGGVKRKHASSSSSSGGPSGSRAQAKKAASKAARRSAAALRREDEESHRESLNDGLFFESDEDEGATSRKSRRGGDDIRIRARRATGGSDEDEDAAGDDEDGEGAPVDPYADETPDEKRVRLAREYLRQIEAEVDEGAEEDEDGVSVMDEEEAEEEARGITRAEAIDRRLRQDILAQQGKLKRIVAHQLYDASIFPPATPDAFMRALPGHKKGGATCITMTEDCSVIYTGGKDCNLIAWDVETGKKLRTMYGNRGGNYAPAGVPSHTLGHTAAVPSVAVTNDGQYLASGGEEGTIKIWDPRSNYSCVKSFYKAHKGSVTALTFRMGTHQLFSGSTDRTIKLYNIDQMAYVETLYGHVSDITSIDSLYRDRCLTSSRDKTARLWKITEESQVPFRASPLAGSLDCVSFINEEQFVSGAQDGSVCAWSTMKKKPTSIIPNAHGGKWITSVGAQKFTDVVFSGSSDGFLNLYCLESSGTLTNKLNLMHRIPIVGYINGIVSDAREGRFVAMAVGQEHRLGRWDKIQAARPGLQLVSLAGAEVPAEIAAEETELDEEDDDDEAEDDDDDDDRQSDEEEDDDHDDTHVKNGPSSSSSTNGRTSRLKQQHQSSRAAIQQSKRKSRR